MKEKKKKENIKDNKENFFIKGLIKPKVEEEKKQNIVCPQTSSVNIEGNEMILNELYILRNRYQNRNKQIQPISEISLFLKGSQTLEIEKILIQKDKILIENPQEVAQFSILADRKKPYIIENKICLNILSEGRIAKDNNLIVQGICFGLFGNKTEPGHVTQDIENINIQEIIKKYWGDKNHAQRVNHIKLDGNKDKLSWNDIIVTQKGVKFDIFKTVKPDLKKIKEIQFTILKEKDDLFQNDNNYMSLEKDKDKDDKQRRTVKATITKVYREPIEDDDNLDDLDPFSSCKRHSNKKYDKIFKERKTTSVRIKDSDEIREIKPDSIILKNDSERKTGTMVYQGKKGGQMIYKKEGDRRTEPILFKNIKDKKVDPNKNKINLVGKSKTQVMFKSKEKKTEYLRDYENEPRYFN